MSKSSEKVQTSLDNLKPLIKKLLDLRMDKRDIEAEIKSIEGTVKEAVSYTHLTLPTILLV